MPTIREEKTELRHREWAEQIQECQSSGMTVTAWCKEKGISQHTYYSRLNVVRKELLKRAGLPLQQIVPLSGIVKKLEDIPIHDAVLFPYDTIDELKKEYLGIDCD